MKLIIMISLLLITVKESVSECMHDKVLALSDPPAVEAHTRRATRTLAREPIRVNYRFNNNDNCGIGACVCKTTDQRIPTLQSTGSTIGCNIDGAILTAETEAYMNLILQEAIKIIQAAFRVDRLTTNLRLTRESTNSPGKYFCGLNRNLGIEIPTEHATTGISNTDLMIYVTAVPIQDSTVAWAVACSVDGDLRPIAGLVNLNVLKLTPKPVDSISFKNSIATIIHEIFHVMGFSSSFYTNPSPWWPQGNPVIGVTEASPTSTGRIASPKVLEKARAHFGCDSITGILLENQGGSGTLGSHWEKRVMGYEAMTGVGTHFIENVLSDITLAYFEDTGVYDVDYTAAKKFWWGKSKGCDFLTKPCGGKSDEFCFNMVSGKLLTPTTVKCIDGPNDEDCSPGGCNTDLTGQGFCSLGTYQSALDPAWQYFPDHPTFGGSGAHYDYCPLYGVPTGRGVSQGLCLEESYNAAVCSGLNRDQCTTNSACLYFSTSATCQDRYKVFGYQYGADSRCFRAKNFVSDAVNYNEPLGARCLKTLCYPSSRTYTITASNGNIATCTTNGGDVTIAGFGGTIVCWDYATMCEGRGMYVILFYLGFEFFLNFFLNMKQKQGCRCSR